MADRQLALNDHPPILITGAARSGTSMVAGLINMCGAFGGDMSGPTRNNARGMFENACIRNQIVKPYLRQQGYDPMGQFPLPDVSHLPIPADWKDRIRTVLAEEGLTPDARWMYKGAKICLMWPVWAHAFPRAKWVIVRRRSADIADSCCKTNFMRAFRRQEFRKAVGARTERDGWIWWIRQHEQRFVEMLNEGVDAKIVWPERMVSGDYSQMHELIDWLGLEWTEQVYQFIDPKLWKARRKQWQPASPPLR